MKNSVISFIQILSLGIYISAQTNQISQQFSVSAHKGNIECWSKESKQWVRVEDFSKLETGSTIATRDNSELQITFEPAIFLSIRANTILTLNNLVKQIDKKIIRTSLILQTGNATIRMQPLASSIVLLSIETPAASITMSNTDAEFLVQQDITTLQVFRGEARLKHTSSDVKSLIYEGNKAVIHTTRPVVEITSASENIKPVSSTVKGPTVAILSIQSGKKNDDNVERISDIVAEQYQKSSNAKVLYLDDIRNLLKAERLEGLLNCFSDSCIAKISTLVGIDMVILGNIGQIGQSYIFSLKMIDVLRDKTLKRVTASVDSNMGLILNKIPDMVGELVITQNQITTKPEMIKNDSSQNLQFKESILWVKGGSFLMGTTEKDEFDALPLHTVNIKGFFMDKYEVTKEDYEKVMGSNPSAIKGCNQCPIENITWFEAQEYCRKVGKRLPTEAEWEYACRAGSTTHFHYGNTLSSDQANFDGRSPYGGVPQGSFKARPVPVGQYKANSLGLHDMHGNISEWCSDWYDPSYYGNSSEKNPEGPVNGKLKVVRGGSWSNAGTTLRSWKRTAYNPNMRLNTIGFRCVKDEY